VCSTIVSLVSPQDGTVFGLPIVMDTADESIKVGDTILLEYKGEKIAIMTVSEKYLPNKPLEAKMCYGTSSIEHPGVQMISMEVCVLSSVSTFTWFRISCVSSRKLVFLLWRITSDSGARPIIRSENKRIRSSDVIYPTVIITDVKIPNTSVTSYLQDLVLSGHAPVLEVEKREYILNTKNLMGNLPFWKQ
jgi:hypothetical protein